MWLARDEDGRLWVYRTCPIRNKKMFTSQFLNYVEINKDEFPEVTWENSPVEITSLKKNSLYEDCLSKVNPETRAEVRKNMEE